MLALCRPAGLESKADIRVAFRGSTALDKPAVVKNNVTVDVISSPPCKAQHCTCGETNGLVGWWFRCWCILCLVPLWLKDAHSNCCCFGSQHTSWRDMFILLTAPVATAVPFAKAGVPVRDVGGTLNVRRTSARGSSLQGRVFKFVNSCFLNGDFNIITLDHMRETKNNPIRDTFTTRSTEPSWKLGRHEGGQHQASCESLRLPRRSRRDCVGFRCISTKFMLLGCCRSPHFNVHE